MIACYHDGETHVKITNPTGHHIRTSFCPLDFHFPSVRIAIVNTPLHNLTAQQLRRAADLREEIDSLQRELNGIFAAQAGLEDGVRPRKTRKISPAGISRIRAAQKARWAKVRSIASSATSGNKPKRKMSAAARARLSAVAKARWRKAKSAGKATL